MAQQQQLAAAAMVYYASSNARIISLPIFIRWVNSRSQLTCGLLLLFLEMRLLCWPSAISGQTFRDVFPYWKKLNRSNIFHCVLLSVLKHSNLLWHLSRMNNITNIRTKAVNIENMLLAWNTHSQWMRNMDSNSGNRARICRKCTFSSLFFYCISILCTNKHNVDSRYKWANLYM